MPQIKMSLSREVLEAVERDRGLATPGAFVDNALRGALGLSAATPTRGAPVPPPEAPESDTGAQTNGNGPHEGDRTAQALDHLSDADRASMFRDATQGH